jgi:hypothetical protein
MAVQYSILNAAAAVWWGLGVDNLFRKGAIFPVAVGVVRAAVVVQIHCTTAGTCAVHYSYGTTKFTENNQSVHKVREHQ